MRAASLLTLAGAASVQAAALQGFNYGSTFTTGAAKQQTDFEAEFKRAQTLQGTSGFNAARLYTMVQAGSTDTPISAIPAAIATKTQLLLGMWASAGQTSFTSEINALKAAIQQYGTDFTDLVVGLSIGSEDLYRVSPTGIENMSGAGASPEQLTSYISQVKSAIAGTSAAKFSLGHVDTWTAWVNGSNSAVIDAVDWLGVDSYPYFESTLANSIENNANLFFQSYNSTVGVAGGRDVWITETGFPVSGKTENQAVPSVQNAETYWQQVACPVLGNINTFWYTLQDAEPDVPNPSFGIIGQDLNSAPLYDLSCKNTAASSSSSASSSTPTSTASGSSSGSGSGSSSGSSTSAVSAVATGSGRVPIASSTIAVVVTPTGTIPSTSTGSGSSSGSAPGSSSPASNTTSPAGSPSVVSSTNGASSMSGSLSAVAAAFGLLFLVARM